MLCECRRAEIMEGNGTPDVCRQCWNELTCWNCRRAYSASLPRNRQQPDYCNPCGMFRIQGDNVKLRAMRGAYA